MISEIIRYNEENLCPLPKSPYVHFKHVDLYMYVLNKIVHLFLEMLIFQITKLLFDIRLANTLALYSSVFVCPSDLLSFAYFGCYYPCFLYNVFLKSNY